MTAPVSMATRPAVLADQLFFVWGTNTRLFQFAPCFCIEVAVFAGRHVLPAELFSDEFLPGMTDHPEEKIVGFG